MTKSAEFHWDQGIKFLIEATKALFLINGAAAIAILSFIGATKYINHSIVISLICFAFGSVSTVFLLVFCYIVQLSYGNAHTVDSTVENRFLNKAQTLHNWAYFIFPIPIVSFLLGVGFTACALWDGSFPIAKG
jgi:hypothetical protein